MEWDLTKDTRSARIDEDRLVPDEMDEMEEPVERPNPCEDMQRKFVCWVLMRSVVVG